MVFMGFRSETRRRLQDSALELFAAQGYAATTVREIARKAGVSHMTFFRHFPTKEAVVLADPYDPLIAEAVRAQPRTLRPMERARRGILAALSQAEAAPEWSDPRFERRLRLVIHEPALRGSMWESNHETQQAIADALVEGGAERLVAEAVAGALIGATIGAMLVWAQEPAVVPAVHAVRAAIQAI